MFLLTDTDQTHGPTPMVMCPISIQDKITQTTVWIPGYRVLEACLKLANIAGNKNTLITIITNETMWSWKNPNV
jgi:hypothetical protein